MIGAAAGGAFVGIMIGRNLTVLKEATANAFESWKTFESKAMVLGSTPKHVLPERGLPKLEGEMEGVRCRAEVTADLVFYGTTRVTATPLQKVEAKVGVYPSPNGLYGYVRTLMSQDVKIGDEAFDEAFLIPAEPESAAASLLGPALRELLTALAGSGRLAGLTYEPGQVTLQMHGAVTDAAMLGAAFQAAILAARWTG